MASVNNGILRSANTVNFGDDREITEYVKSEESHLRPGERRPGATWSGRSTGWSRDEVGVVPDDSGSCDTDK